jgi:hypothetical protein
MDQYLNVWIVYILFCYSVYISILVGIQNMSYDLEKLKVAVKMILHSSHQNAIVGKIYHTYIFSAKKLSI